MVSGANFNLFKNPMMGLNGNQFSSQKIGGHNPAVEGEFGSKHTKAVGGNYNQYATNPELCSRLDAMGTGELSPKYAQGEHKLDLVG